MKKMRKAKVITALALTVVMLVAMTGIAAANPAQMQIGPDPIEVTPGGPESTATISISDLSTTMTARTITVWSDTALLQVRVTKGSYDSDWTTTTHVETNWNTGGAADTTWTLHVTADSGFTGGQIYVYDNSGADFNIASDTCSASPKATAIPEFATIAIPVAAIFGLVLFFNHRKRKKE